MVLECGLIIFFCKIACQEPLGRKQSLLSLHLNSTSCSVVVFLKKWKFFPLRYIQVGMSLKNVIMYFSVSFVLTRVNPLIISVDCSSKSLKINLWYSCSVDVFTFFFFKLQCLTVFFISNVWYLPVHSHRQNVYIYFKLTENWKCRDFDTLQVLWLKDSLCNKVTPQLFLWWMHLKHRAVIYQRLRWSDSDL